MSSDEELCVVCCREITLYATGPCDHHVCYECSTRMRVLCEQNECPICRSDMPFVIFSHKKKSFSSPQKFNLVNKKYTIVFEDQSVEDAFKLLLQNRCKECGNIFDTFEDLKTHVQRNHSLFFCELCVQNLKIFTFERKCYTRKELALHKRKGDPDNTSHRGHPLCQFCDKRFVDLDELYRHLRREHYYCHFCDADGVDGQFYKDYSYLKVHFRKRHFLCEEGDCAQDKFVVAFRTEIDLKAHKAVNHTKNKTKAEAKQARILDLAFPILPRSSSNGDSSPNHSDYRHGRHGQQNSYERKKNSDEHLTSRDVPEEFRGSKQVQNKTFNTQCAQDFPSLVNGSVPKGNEYFLESNRYSSCISNDYNQPIRQDRTATRKHAQVEDFPALSAPANQRSSSNTNKCATVYGQSQNSSSNHALHLKKWSRPPSIQENTRNNEKVKAQSATWRQPKKPLTNLEEEFPKLQSKVRQLNVSLTEEVPQGEWDKSEARPVMATSGPLSQQIYQKCKSKKKQKYAVEDEEQEEEREKYVTIEQPPSLTKMYGGFSNYNVLENEENKDPLSTLNVKVNKIERLRNEDQDDDVPWRENVHLVEDDFPPLGPPVATSRCPPGFNSVSATDVSSAPPGFKEKAKSAYPSLNSSISLSSIAQQLSGDNEAMSIDKVLNHSYQPPYDFQERNTLLIQQIYEFVESDNKLFDEFRSLSGTFRKDKISAAEYHFNCMRILGKEKFLQLFTELLCLLPDINKQQELLTVHNAFLKQDSKKKGAVPKRKGTKIPSSLLTVCQICQQVLVKSDFSSHMENHKNVSNV